MNRHSMTHRDRTRKRVPGVRGPAQPGLTLAGLALFVLVLVAIIYWPVLTAQAQCFDDSQYLTQNELVQKPGWESAKRFLIEVLEPSTVSGYYQPLAMISLMLDCALGGRDGDFTAFHRTNLILHLVNTLLIILLLYSLLGNAWVSAVTGLLFGVHPMTVETVAWVSDRKTLLATTFALGCLIGYVRFARTARWTPYGLSLGLYLLALMSKPTSTFLPLGFLVLDFWPLRRLGRRSLLEKAPFFVLSGVSAIITVISQKRTCSIILPTESSWMGVVYSMCHNIVFYLAKIICPIHVSSFYPQPHPMSLSHPAILAGVLGTAILVLLLLVSLRWTRACLAGWLFFFVVLFPTMGGIGFTVVVAANRYAYLPSLGLLLVFAWGAARLLDRWPSLRARAVLVLLMAGVVLSEAAGTRRVLAQWQDSETHFRYMLALAPDQPEVLLSLGVVLANDGKLDEAILHISRSVELKPDIAYAQNHLAVLLGKKGQFEAAIPHLREAIRYYKQDVRMRTHWTTARVNLGNMLLQLGRKDEAIAVFREAVAEDPNNLTARLMIGAGLGDAGSLDESIGHLQEVLRMDPQHARARETLNAVLELRAQTRPAAP